MAPTASEVASALLHFAARFEHESALAYYPEAEFDPDEGGWSTFDYEVSQGELPDIGTFRVIENVGGEGQGDHAHLVFQIDDPEGNLLGYYRTDGYYSSFDGTEWDGTLYEVNKVERLVTFYE
jgi:hypothetical protein